LAKLSAGKSVAGELSTVIGTDAEFEGRLKVKYSVRIDGKMVGEIASNELVTIGPDGGIEGDIIAKDVVIGGKVVGRVQCSGKVVLEETAILTGDLKTLRLVVEEGALFNGRSEMGEPARQHPPKQIVLDEDN